MAARDAKPTQIEPNLVQNEPTAPQATDADGRIVDNWGLPVNGVARARALAAAGRPDPLVAPDAWAAASPQQD